MILIFLLLLIIILSIMIFIKRGNLDNALIIKYKDLDLYLVAEKSSERLKEDLYDNYGYMDYFENVEKFKIKDEVALGEIILNKVLNYSKCNDAADEVRRVMKILTSYSDDMSKILTTVGIALQLEKLDKTTAIISEDLLPFLLERILSDHQLTVDVGIYETIVDKAITDILYNKNLKLLLISEKEDPNTDEVKENIVKFLSKFKDNSVYIYAIHDYVQSNGMCYHNKMLLEGLAASNVFLDDDRSRKFITQFSAFYRYLYRKLNIYNAHNKIFDTRLLYKFMLLLMDENNEGKMKELLEKEFKIPAGEIQETIREFNVICQDVVLDNMFMFIDKINKLSNASYVKIRNYMLEYNRTISYKVVDNDLPLFLKRLSHMEFYIDVLLEVSKYPDNNVILYADEDITDFIKKYFSGHIFGSLFKEIHGYKRVMIKDCFQELDVDPVDRAKIIQSI